MVVTIGGGIRPDTEKIFNMLLKDIYSAKVLYVPYAMEKESYTDCFMFIQHEMNFEQITQIVMLEKREIYREWDFDNFDIMYIGGGNVFTLLKFLQDTNFDQVIKHWVLTGKIVIGSSAGAIVLGKDAKMHRTPTIILDNYRGLNLCDEASFACHYKENGYYKGISSEIIKKNILNYVNETSSKVLAIPEDGALFFDSDGKIIDKTMNNIYEFKKDVCNNSVCKISLLL